METNINEALGIDEPVMPSPPKQVYLLPNKF